MAERDASTMASSANLYAVLRAGFRDDLDSTAIETVADAPLRYTWRDIERATAMLANLLDSLDLPSGARIAVQADKSVESLLFYLAVLRAGGQVERVEQVGEHR